MRLTFELLLACQKFIKEHKISSPKCVHQNLWESLDFIEEICQIVGYYKEEESK